MDDPILWDKLVRQFKSHYVGVAILAVVVAVPAVQVLRDAAVSVRGSELRISALDAARVLPLSGYPVLEMASGPHRRVYTRGAKINMVLQHNGRGADEITVTGLRLRVVDYEDGEHPEYRYEINADSIVGAGIARPKVYNVLLLGLEPSRATWLAEKGLQPLTAKSSNFLDTDDPFSFTLTPGGGVETVQINVSAERVGLYVITIECDYLVGNDPAMARAQPSIVIYRQK